MDIYLSHCYVHEAKINKKSRANVDIRALNTYAVIIVVLVVGVLNAIVIIIVVLGVRDTVLVGIFFGPSRLLVLGIRNLRKRDVKN